MPASARSGTSDGYTYQSSLLDTAENARNGTMIQSAQPSSSCFLSFSICLMPGANTKTAIRQITSAQRYGVTFPEAAPK